MDTPGHTFAIKFGAPQIMDCVKSLIQRLQCPEPPCGYLNVSIKMRILPSWIYTDAWDIFDDKCFHIGADEVQDACWGKNTDQLYRMVISNGPRCQFKRKQNTYFMVGGVAITAQIGQNSFDIIANLG